MNFADFGETQFGDCMSLLGDIPDSSIDLVLCDPPYGTTAPKWDRVLDFDVLWTHYKRILKPDGTIVLCSAQPFTTMLIQSNIKNFRYCWYWFKNQGTNFFHAKRMPIRKVEELCVFMKGRYYPQKTTGHVPTQSAKGCSNGNAYHGTKKRDYKGGDTTRYPVNVLDFKCVDNYSRIHSSQKPVDLFEYMIRTYTDEGDTILDNCSGSGTTAIASINTKRKFILMEMDKKYYNLGNVRIREHINQLTD